MNYNLKLVKNYFIKFSQKDLNSLEKNFSKNIVLEDWYGSKKGIISVMKYNKELFFKFKKIRIEVVNILNKKNIYCAQLKIFVNSNSKFISVVDIITIKNNKIEKIKAYKC